jgi:RNA polymerase sigma factor (sigma-70 family)
VVVRDRAESAPAALSRRGAAADALARVDLPSENVPPEEPRLASALALLTAEERDVLLLYARAELSYAEIADALGVPVGTVRSRLHRARSRLREALMQEEVLDG